jgi:CheY-like chemotaxis protein
VDSGCSVLVVEDDPAIRRLLKMVLERETCTVETAADGIEAVLKLGLADFNVIILDLMMPNLDGFSFIETLAASDPQRLRQIIVTSAASPAVIRDRMKGKPFSVLPKPFDLAQLVSLVHQCMKAQNAE